MPKVPNTFRCTGSSCAACTYNRKRCQPWCEYAQIFRDVISRQDYRTIFTVFGVKNVADILQNIPEYQHLETLYSFLFEAKARIENPIKGCTALLASLEQKVEELQERVTTLEARRGGTRACPHGGRRVVQPSTRGRKVEAGKKKGGGIHVVAFGGKACRREIFAVSPDPLIPTCHDIHEMGWYWSCRMDAHPPQLIRHPYSISDAKMNRKDMEKWVSRREVVLRMWEKEDVGRDGGDGGALSEKCKESFPVKRIA
ncbi:hypothetical protein LguiA_032470 [Lonicera macranthoides]